MKPENAINIPEKYKIKIENLNKKKDEKQNNESPTPNRKQPIRIRPSTSNPIINKTEKTTSPPKPEELTIDLTENVRIQYF